MGNALQEKDDLEAAIDSYKHSIKIKPDYAEAYNNMGIALTDKSDLEAAVDSYKQAIKIKPDYAEAHRNQSSIKKYEERDNHFIQMERLYSDHSITEDLRCHLCFALAKATEDLVDNRQSFQYLKEGNYLRKKLLGYSITQDEKIFADLKHSSNISTLNITKRPTDSTPVFIVGMPRSGTTLVEQIVSSHSKVKGAGELSYVTKFGLGISVGTIEPTERNVTDFRIGYLDALRKVSYGKPFVTDKMPHNFRNIGLICAAFPEAKIIHVKRDAAATCWSNFKQYFPLKGLGYCYDIDDLVKYYGLYCDLMQFWHKKIPGCIYDLSYDELTANQEEETRRLMQHIGLDWEDACLSPEMNKRTVHTASQQQVRKKVYQGSSQEWRKFELYLNGSFDHL
jgi:tetratricopeptide (TPR) repeat protein